MNQAKGKWARRARDYRLLFKQNTKSARLFRLRFKRVGKLDAAIAKC